MDVSGQPDAVLKVAEEHNIMISAVLTTHKHWDHAGGNDVMKSIVPGKCAMLALRNDRD